MGRLDPEPTSPLEHEPSLGRPLPAPVNPELATSEKPQDMEPSARVPKTAPLSSSTSSRSSTTVSATTPLWAASHQHFSSPKPLKEKPPFLCPFFRSRPRSFRTGSTPGLRLSYAGSPFLQAVSGSTVLADCFGTASSPPAAPHPASRRRSCLQLHDAMPASYSVFHRLVSSASYSHVGLCSATAPSRSPALRSTREGGRDPIRVRGSRL